MPLLVRRADEERLLVPGEEFLDREVLEAADRVLGGGLQGIPRAGVVAVVYAKRAVAGTGERADGVCGILDAPSVAWTSLISRARSHTSGSRFVECTSSTDKTRSRYGANPQRSMPAIRYGLGLEESTVKCAPAWASPLHELERAGTRLGAVAVEVQHVLVDHADHLAIAFAQAEPLMEECTALGDAHGR